jgi:hypothetical protein
MCVLPNIPFLQTLPQYKTATALKTNVFKAVAVLY